MLLLLMIVIEKSKNKDQGKVQLSLPFVILLVHNLFFDILHFLH